MGATDPIGHPLTDAICFEFKNGYQHAHIGDMVDKIDSTKLPELGQFFVQAIQAAAVAKTKTWAVVHKRQRKETLIWMPLDFFGEIKADKSRPCPLLIYRQEMKHNAATIQLRVVAMRLEHWFEIIHPDMIKNWGC